jgi:hypothetical protein
MFKVGSKLTAYSQEDIKLMTLLFTGNSKNDIRLIVK